MSLTKEALVHLEKNYAAGVGVDEVDFGAIILPVGFDIKRTEYLNEERDQFRGSFKTHRIEDFALYANAQKGKPPVFIDHDNMTARAIFDMGDIEHPLHCKHSACVRMKQTPEYSHLICAVLDSVMSQMEFAEFLEDYNAILQCADSIGDPMPIKKAIAAVRRVTVEHKAKQESEVQSYSTKQSAMEQIEAKSGDNQLPAYVVLEAPLFYGLSTYPIKMRVSLLPRTGPTFKLRAINHDKVLETCAEEFRAKIVASVVSDDVYIGSMDVG